MNKFGKDIKRDISLRSPQNEPQVSELQFLLKKDKEIEVKKDLPTEVKKDKPKRKEKKLIDKEYKEDDSINQKELL